MCEGIMARKGSTLIAKELNEAGYRNTVGKPWKPMDIPKFVYDCKNVGTMIINKERHDFESKQTIKLPKEEWVYVENALPPIVTQEVMDFRTIPEVFKGSPALSARSTVVLRCVLSMDAFCERLKELNPALQIRREACARYMKYMNYHTPEAVKFVSHQGPWYEEYRKFKESHTRPDRLVTSLFNSPDYIRKNVNPDELMWGLYWIASDLQNVEIEVAIRN